MLRYSQDKERWISAKHGDALFKVIPGALYISIPKSDKVILAGGGSRVSSTGDQGLPRGRYVG